MKKLYIFGNGLGRSFDNDFYCLDRALKTSWGEEGPLSAQQRQLINSCLDDELIENEAEAPTSEEQLRDLQRVVDACDLIAVFQERTNYDEGWLTGEGVEFPRAVRRYFHHAASQFHDQNKYLPEVFANRFREFVREHRPHIATLNYDDLLYDAYVGYDIASDHLLRDGFFKSFDFEKHQGYFNSQNEGWFLHLHGSPLFVTRNGIDQKLTRADLGSYRGSEKTHLVLTHAKSKPGAIRSSPILSAYWKELDTILCEPTEVTLFGYGGMDLHLNNLLSNTDDHVVIRVASRMPEDEGKCIEDWRKRIRNKDIPNENFIFVGSLMDFDQW
ncbi:hypothetical protein [uncultured Aliiroseovarius sp.]|uniref:hypothetical protein n=1 Tax=uncultured Aliiroseovarius sp. TaxID=1658783 RepID=UPI002627D716|nr:hypothetical protein [uncultured Aliiroseovarius sp.]